ncbi:sugar phosphate isomerase/epimerase [Aureimonas sp. SK2]|uniref:sugar phosphate isomerase/epimerase family protein n=1 Tax=Aureimonas sp. SK2 TaxID=3015992 RepID=UPI002444D10D|nr:sugar phosphate isomerase/epimerase [Aureimonas sp. SK2]
MRPASVSTALFDGYPMALAIEEIARAGAENVEPAFIQGYVAFDESAFEDRAARDLAASIANAGLGVQAVSAHMDLSRPGAEERLRRRLGFAAGLGARFLVTNAGPAAAREAIERCIVAVLPACEAAGIVLALENPGHGAGDLVPDRAAGADLVARLRSPHLKLNYDAGNVFTYSRETVRPEDDLAGAGSEIGHVHLKDVATSPEGWRFTALGDGSIDWRAVWRHLPRDCPVGIELPLRLDRSGRRDPERRADPLSLETLREALRRSLAFLDALEADRSAT